MTSKISIDTILNGFSLLSMQAFIHDFKNVLFKRLCSVAIYLKFVVLKVNNPIILTSAYSPATVRTLGTEPFTTSTRS